MGVLVAEYFGQRTDVDEPVIVPKREEDICPFSSGNTCKKLKSHNPPVCSVRKPDGTMWIVCSDRLCNTKKDIPLCDHQRQILLEIAKHIFSPDVTMADVCVKREERLNVVEGTKYNADYIISLASGHSNYSGPDRLVLEMQGGGETSNTGKITTLLTRWMADPNKVVEVPESTMQKTAESFPDLRGMKKAERTPILKQKMSEVKTSLRQFLSGIKGGNFEFEVNGNVLEAKLYDTGIKEVLEKITQDKANMLSQSDQIFKNAEYLYSLPDYDGDSNIYRWNYFYTPVKIGDSTVGVRIAVRDMKQTADGRSDSQIYNWGIKKAPTLDGGSPEQSSLSPVVSSVGGIDASLDGARPLPDTGSNPGGVSSDASSGNTGTVLNMEKISPQVTPEAPQRANASTDSIPTAQQNVNRGQAEDSGNPFDPAYKRNAAPSRSARSFHSFGKTRCKRVRRQRKCRRKSVSIFHICPRPRSRASQKRQAA